MPAAETHFRKRSISLGHTFQDFASVVRQWDPYRTHVVGEGWNPSQLSAERSAEGEVNSEEFLGRLEIALIPDALVERLD